MATAIIAISALKNPVREKENTGYNASDNSSGAHAPWANPRVLVGIFFNWQISGGGDKYAS